MTKKKHAGRPTMKPGTKRVQLITTVAPETPARLRQIADLAYVSLGQAIDALCKKDL